MILFFECFGMGVLAFGICAVISVILGFFRGENIEEQCMYAWLSACIICGLVVFVGYLVLKMGGIL